MNPAAAPFVPSSKHTSDLSSEVSTVPHTNPSQAVDSTTKITPEQLDNKNLTARANIAKSHSSIYFHKFLEIKCSYLCPNNLDNSFLSRDNSEFVIFHNNINLKLH